MALFPKAQLRVLLPGGELRAGQRAVAILEIEAPQPIRAPRRASRSSAPSRGPGTAAARTVT